MLGLGISACAHHQVAPKPPLSNVAQIYAHLANETGQPLVEEEFLDARLTFQSLPVYAPEREALRSRLLAYLLAPLDAVTAETLRATSDGLVNAEYDKQVLASFQDALTLFHPAELAHGLRLPALDHQRLLRIANLVRTLFGAQGAEGESILALAVLAVLEPSSPRWSQELQDVLTWAQYGKQLTAGNSQRESPPTPRRLLEEATWRWPSPALVKGLSASIIDRHDQLTGHLRRPLGGGTHAGMFGEELLEDADAVTVLAPTIATVYLRAADIDGASAALARLKDLPGDDAALRALVNAVAHKLSPSPAEFAALARRFLPKLPLLDGTSADRVDAWAAFRVLELGLRFHPKTIELLVLQSRVARLVNSPLLALELLEEAEPLMRQQSAAKREQEGLAKETVELQFALFRVRMDPEDIRPAQRHAEGLRSRMKQARQQFGDKLEWLSDKPVELELARNYVDAGMTLKAEPILSEATQEANVEVETTLQLGNLFLKKGNAAEAVRVLHEGLERHQPEEPPQETIGYVESHSKLARALGQALELAGRDSDAQKAYRTALLGWDRLMIDHLRNRRRGPRAEATLEVARLYYLMGRREEGLQKFAEAVEADETRDQTYSDSLAFLVQRGELDAAIDIFRRALSKGGDAVSEYVKVYASLWIVDLSKRNGRAPEPSAQAYLAFIAHRALVLRPPRAAAWYAQLARFALGEVSFNDLQAQAATPGRKAEILFYQSMHLLQQGKNDEAHTLWTQVLQTDMVSFFEYEMASYYLRQGALNTPKEVEHSEGQTI
jgi:tetratricopeptide (TPR) repeat protein